MPAGRAVRQPSQLVYVVEVRHCQRTDHRHRGAGANRDGHRIHRSRRLLRHPLGARDRRLQRSRQELRDRNPHARPRSPKAFRSTATTTSSSTTTTTSRSQACAPTGSGSAGTGKPITPSSATTGSTTSIGQCEDFDHLIYLSHGNNVQIYDNWMWNDPHGWGVQVYPAASNADIYSNVIDQRGLWVRGRRRIRRLEQIDPAQRRDELHRPTGRRSAPRRRDLQLLRIGDQQQLHRQRQLQQPRRGRHRSRPASTSPTSAPRTPTWPTPPPTTTAPPPPRSPPGAVGWSNSSTLRAAGRGHPRRPRRGAAQPGGQQQHRTQRE